MLTSIEDAGAAFKARFLAVIVSITVLLICVRPANGQAGSPTPDANLANPTQVVTVKRDGYTVAGLVTHLQGVKTFKHAVALFPGHPGIMKLREKEGQARFELRGNFLVRSRRHWLDAQTLVVVVDAPSDQWATFYQTFRETPRYGADVGALLKEVAQRFGVDEWTFVGTSEGSVSALHAARMNAGLKPRLILTSSLFQATRNGPGLSGVSSDAYPERTLWVHHESDLCTYTQYRDAQRFADKSRRPLVTVRGGDPGRGDPCGPFAAHGFVGIEGEAVRAMRSWVNTGVVPSDVSR